MKPTARNLQIMIALLVLALSALACSLPDIQLESGGTRITVTLKEDQINTFLKNSNNSSENNDPLLKEVTGVDMQEGMIRVLGMYQKPDGTQAEGSYDVSILAENAQLKAKITELNIEGVDLNDPRVEKTNRELEQRLTASYQNGKGDVNFESVEVTDQAMTIVIKTIPNQN